MFAGTRWRDAFSLLLCLTLFLTGCKPQTRHLRVTFLDVGQGDATVIESPSGQVMVVDGGGKPGSDERDGSDPGTRIVVPYLQYRGISTVDWLVATHADDDHVQGLIAVAKRLKVRHALINGFPGGGSEAYRRLLSTLKARGVVLHIANRGQKIDLGRGVFADVLHPTRPYLTGTRSDDNENSVVLRLVYGKARILLTGDSGAEAEQTLLASGLNLRADVLKLGHHGSRWSSGEAFLDAVRPTVAIASAGKNNVYGHPSGAVLDRLKQRNITIFATNQHGAIVLETDGKTIRCTPTVPEKTKGRDQKVAPH